MSGENRLPEPAIERIQSFLTSKEAAQTTTISNPWRSAWLTRPNLDFDLRDFNGSWDSFLEFADKTFKRYEDSNLNIDSFSLPCIDSYWSYRPCPIANLIVRAIKFGASRLSVNVNSWDFVLPNEVFACGNLVALAVKGCGIDLGRNPNVGCSRLRSLSLEDVNIVRRHMFFHMISSCPVVEELSLCRMHEFGGLDVGGGGGPIVVLRRLRSLVLDHVDFCTWFLDDLSSKFPSLKDLTMRVCIGKAQEEMLISSTSLERLDFIIERYANPRSVSDTTQRVKLDVPSIRKLTFEGSVIPSSAIRSDSMVWKYDVHHRKCRLTANNIDFLGETLLRGLNVRISTLSQLMCGLNDLKEARAQIFDEAAFKWRDVPLVDNPTILEHRRNVRFKMIWQPKQKLNVQRKLRGA